MGNIESDEFNYSSHSKFIEKIHHAYLGDVNVYKVPKDSFKYFIACVKTRGFIGDIYDHINLRHNNIANVYKAKPGLVEVLGLQSTSAYYLMDYFEVSLQDIINTRQYRNQYFKEDEIWRLTKDILGALSYLHSKNIAHWNLQPKTIYYDTYDKKVVLYDNELINGQLDAFNRIDQSLYGCYCTPEIEKSIKLKSQQTIDKYRYQSDIYSLGLTLLETCLFLPSAQLYRSKIEGIGIKQQLVSERLFMIKQRYSVLLQGMIADMLQTDPEQRPLPQQLLTKYYQKLGGGHLNEFRQYMVEPCRDKVISVQRALSPIQTYTVRTSQVARQPSQLVQPIVQSQVLPTRSLSPFAVLSSRQASTNNLLSTNKNPLLSTNRVTINAPSTTPQGATYDPMLAQKQPLQFLNQINPFQSTQSQQLQSNPKEPL